MWETDMAFFSRNFQPVAFDFPGFGSSPSMGPELSMEAAADAAKKLCDDLFPEEKIILCGLSMGGYAAFEFARKYGNQLRGLILASTRAAPDSPEARENRFRMIDTVKSQGVNAIADAMLPKLLGKTATNLRPELVARVREIILKNTPDGVAAALQGMANRRDSTSLLAEMRYPVLILAGEEDTLIKAEESKAMAEKLPRARFECFREAGHLINLEQPEAFEKSIVNFLKAKVL